jgi:hypothetical protein
MLIIWECQIMVHIINIISYVNINLVIPHFGGMNLISIKSHFLVARFFAAAPLAKSRPGSPRELDHHLPARPAIAVGWLS